MAPLIEIISGNGSEPTKISLKGDIFVHKEDGVTVIRTKESLSSDVFGSDLTVTMKPNARGQYKGNLWLEDPKTNDKIAVAGIEHVHSKGVVIKDGVDETASNNSTGQ